MARVTVEDCIEKVPNRFELVMLALQRSRDIVTGASPNIPRDGDKNPVIALREIAESKVDREKLWEELGEQFHIPETTPAAEEDQDPAKLLEAALEKGSGTESGGDNGLAGSQEATDDKQWSEEDMIRALQDMEGEPSP